jgi:hypothetical protein
LVSGAVVAIAKSAVGSVADQNVFATAVYQLIVLET